MDSKRHTWRPVIMIAALCSVALVIIWMWPEVQRQQRYLRTAGTLLTGTVLAMLWFLFRGPPRVRTRVAVLLGGVVLVGIVASSFRIAGVTGDLIPILEPRWKRVQHPIDAASTPQTTNRLRVSGSLVAASFPQFYGPHRNAVVDAPRLDTNWSVRPPEILWKQPIGAGWSGFVVHSNMAVTQEQHGDLEQVACYDLLTGRQLWSHRDNARYATTIAGEGPRATPTIASNRVFSFGASGILNCLDLGTGKLIWSRDAARENDARIPEWGFSSSPLIVGDKVIVSVGGSNNRSLVAYRTADGEFVWGTGDRGAGYSSPVEARLLGERQILYFSTDAILSFSLDGGALWEHPWQRSQPKVSLPVVISTNLVFISSGYGAGCELIALSRQSGGDWKTDSIWKTLALKSKFAPIFPKGDFIYGLDDGIFTCVDLKTGQRRWKDGRYGHGQGLLVAGMILLSSESGEVILIEPNSEKLTELGRFQIFSDKTWNPPALAGEYLLVRNDREAACLQLPTVTHVTKM